MAKCLVIRMSAFGDVAMLVPVIYSVAIAYPQVQFQVLTRAAFVPLFQNISFNVSAISVDTKNKHKGFLGTMKLFFKMSTYRFTHVADEHDVIRSKVIRTIQRIYFAKIAVLDKKRKEKEFIIQTKKTNNPIQSTINRYLDVFKELGFEAPMIYESFFNFAPRDFSLFSAFVAEKMTKWIGIAPFAQHKGKIYPKELMEQVLEKLSKDSNISVFLFRGGSKEEELVDEWKKKYPNIIDHKKFKLKLQTELALMSYLDVMVSMDSANMHLASIVNIPVVSIWGATDPSLGFYGFRQDINNAIRANDVTCRPCSVYGNKSCALTEDRYACLTHISPDRIINKIYEVIA